MTRWFIADNHFYHANVIKYDNRPFKDVEEMNVYMISQWNKVVKPEDEVYHLGDFAFGSIEKQKAILDQLNGHKTLILGNHDKKTAACYKIGWDVVRRWAPIPLATWPISFWLLHDPEHGGIYKKLVHGHTHKKATDKNRLCVSANLIDYTPISEEDILKHFQLSNELE